MRVHRDNLPVRVAGFALGVGFIVVGAYAMFGADASVSAHAAERAAAFGFTAIIGGVWAALVSWLAADLSNIWCRPPRRWRDM